MTFTEFSESDAARRPHLLLVGDPVEHSLSPLMHNAAAEHAGVDLRYHAVRLEEAEFTSFIAHCRRGPFRGGNVTIPWKQRVGEAADRLIGPAKATGAVNTLVADEQGLAGYNTDPWGFLQPLKPFRGELYGGMAIVFGTGGAALAVIHALRREGMSEIAVISRNPEQTAPLFSGEDLRVEGYGQWTALADDAVLIVNTTPLGMAPETDASPVRDGEVKWLRDKIVYDIVYRPRLTRLLEQARSADARTIGGAGMLLHQGSRSFELWTGRPFPLNRIRTLLHEHLD